MPSSPPLLNHTSAVSAFLFRYRFVSSPCFTYFTNDFARNSRANGVASRQKVDQGIQDMCTSFLSEVKKKQEARWLERFLQKSTETQLGKSWHFTRNCTGFLCSVGTPFPVYHFVCDQQPIQGASSLGFEGSMYLSHVVNVIPVECAQIAPNRNGLLPSTDPWRWFVHFLATSFDLKPVVWKAIIRGTPWRTGGLYWSRSLRCYGH